MLDYLYTMSSRWFHIPYIEKTLKESVHLSGHTPSLQSVVYFYYGWHVGYFAKWEEVVLFLG